MIAVRRIRFRTWAKLVALVAWSAALMTTCRPIGRLAAEGWGWGLGFFFGAWLAVAAAGVVGFCSWFADAALLDVGREPVPPEAPRARHWLAALVMALLATLGVEALNLEFHAGWSWGRLAETLAFLGGGLAVACPLCFALVALRRRWLRVKPEVEDV